MSDKKDGDPNAVRHLRPDNMPGTTPVEVHPDDDFDDDPGWLVAQLEKLRAPFPPEEIEKRPQPMWRNAWEGLKNSRCEECGGNHPAQNTIHLSYVGHAGVTRRLLEVDPLWDWEPVATDEDGLPRFDRFGGLWIRLTVCGVTRRGYGDAAGKGGSSTAVKEIIGDALRNAAMRFGVALDLWSKLDRHEAKQAPATVDRPVQRQVRGSGADHPRSSAAPGDTAAEPGSGGDTEAELSRAFNQDALDELLSICTEQKIEPVDAAIRYAESHPGEDIRNATPEDIRAFAIKLIEEVPDPDKPLF